MVEKQSGVSLGSRMIKLAAAGQGYQEKSRTTEEM